MPCPHKFIDDLNLENLDFTPTTLIVGTFNPAWPANNQAKWFYGRTRNNYFWDVLPALFQESGLRNAPVSDRPAVWKQFCNRQRIAITDLISCINDAHTPLHDALLNGYEDSKIAKHFSDFVITDITGLLQQYRSIQNVFLTTKAQIPLFNQIWNGIDAYCRSHQIYCRRLLTPSGSARYQIPRGYVPRSRVYDGVLANFILENWRQEWYQNNF